MSNKLIEEIDEIYRKIKDGDLQDYNLVDEWPFIKQLIEAQDRLLKEVGSIHYTELSFNPEFQKGVRSADDFWRNRVSKILFQYQKEINKE